MPPRDAHQTRVFLSSTFTDLEDHRVTVQNGLRQLGAIDVSMEHFGARDERPAKECVRLVKEKSDVFVGIYAHRYGFVPERRRKSICELEYDAASNMERHIYIVDDEQPWKPAHIDGGDPAAQLAKFKTRLQKHHVCGTFRSQDDLATSVVADIGRFIAQTTAPKVGKDLPVPAISVDSLRGKVSESETEWNQRRSQVYKDHRGIFLTHVLRPSEKPGQVFDVSIYLYKHDSDDLSDVKVAEFFLGKYWGNKVFPAVSEHGYIGITTSAYGTFLCICRVTFQDDYEIMLERYIDFESYRK